MTSCELTSRALLRIGFLLGLFDLSPQDPVIFCQNIGGSYFFSLVSSDFSGGPFAN